MARQVLGRLSWADANPIWIARAKIEAKTRRPDQRTLMIFLLHFTLPD
jgi:hypothetical protein